MSNKQIRNRIKIDKIAHALGNKLYHLKMVSEVQKMELRGMLKSFDDLMRKNPDLKRRLRYVLGSSYSMNRKVSLVSKDIDLLFSHISRKTK